MLAALEAHGCRPEPRGKHIGAHCPAHNDTNPSLELDVGDNGRALVHCFAGCPPEAILAALGLKMSDLFPAAPARPTWHRRGPTKTRAPAGPQDIPYGIVPRCLPEHFDVYCVALYALLDARQGNRKYLSRGDQHLANALGWQATTVRVHARHLAGAGWIRVDLRETEAGARRSTVYEVIHNPAREIVNPNATAPIRKVRARPAPRQPVARKTRDTPRASATVTRQTRDSHLDTAVRLTRRVARLAREADTNVRRETRDLLGTQKGIEKRDSSFLDELDPEGDVMDVSAEVLDQAPWTDPPSYDDADLTRLFGHDELGDRRLTNDPESERFGGMDVDAIAAILQAFPGAELTDEETLGVHDAKPTVDPYRCVSCGAHVAPAPASIEHGWATVCHVCSEAGRRAATSVSTAEPRHSARHTRRSTYSPT
jgi:hypothetical protein